MDMRTDTAKTMKNKKMLIATLCLLVVAALMLAAYALLSPRGAAGAKEITLTVTNGQSEKKTLLHTEQAYLRGALEEQGLVSGEEGPYGLFVKTVDGYTADETKQEWWCLTKGGETVTTGVDTTPIIDGDAYELTLTTGY